MRRRTVLQGLAVVLALIAPPATAVAQPKPLVVFAASSLKNALDAVAADWTKATGRRVAISYAASSTLARQIEAGAPADIFISADRDWMDYLAARKRIRPETRSDLLANAIVVVAPADAGAAIAIVPGFPIAAALGQGGRLALANVASVPAGRYAKAALETLGVWNSVADRIVQADDVRGALAFVARREAPLGIVYRTDAAAEPKVRIAGTFPPATHPPIVYPVATTAGAAGPETTRFLAFLRSAAARAAFERQGFTVLPPSAS